MVDLFIIGSLLRHDQLTSLFLSSLLAEQKSAVRLVLTVTPHLFSKVYVDII